MFEPIKIESRKQVLYNNIKEVIFTGQLSPGDSLKEMHLATQFNVSQAVVREALFQLEQDGLTTKIPNKGTIVKTLSENEIQERILVRVCLEELACQSAAKKMVGDDFLELKKLLTQLEEAISKKQHLEQTKIDLAFHQYIWKKSNNKILFNTLTQIVTPLFFISFNLKEIKLWTKMSDLVTLHEKYLNAIKNGNKSKIKSAVASHVKDVIKIYQMEDTNPDIE
jgi:DNA-binding GntR family transcriptional regulator